MHACTHHNIKATNRRAATKQPSPFFWGEPTTTKHQILVERERERASEKPKRGTHEYPICALSHTQPISGTRKRVVYRIKWLYG